jgi:thiol-disulfide isomerase/thioredoxin
MGVLLAVWTALMPIALRASDAQLEPWHDRDIPRLVLPGLDGATVDLSAQTGALVIVHFFATWCEPCRDELKSIERLATLYAGRPLRIIAVDVGEPGDRVRRFLERNGIVIRYPVLVDFDKQAMRDWRVEILPTSYVLDAALCPLWKVGGALAWDIDPVRSMLDEQIAELERATVRSKEENCIVKGGKQ